MNKSFFSSEERLAILNKAIPTALGVMLVTATYSSALVSEKGSMLLLINAVGLITIGLWFLIGKK